MCLPQISEEARLEGRVQFQLSGRRLILDNSRRRSSDGKIKPRFAPKQQPDASADDRPKLENEPAGSEFAGQQAMVGPKKEALDYTQFGVNYMFRKACEAMVSAASR